MAERSRVLGLVRGSGSVAILRPVLRGILAALLLVCVVQGSVLAAPVSWDYVALGDSLATGFGASRGYVPRYETYVETDTGAMVALDNLGRNGWTSSQLLSALKNDPNFRGRTGEAEVVTFDIGGNDLRAARDSYKKKTCGGADNQDCLRAAVAKFKTNWDAIVVEIAGPSGLRPTANNNTIVRTMDMYNPYVKPDKASDTWQNDGGLNDFQVFKPYLDAANNHIATTATRTGVPVPYAKVYLAFNGPNGDQDPGAKGYLAFDRLHPNDKGHKVIADQVRALGYSPLR